MTQTILDELKWRDSVFDFTEHVPELLKNEKISLYNGFDPTADSLHVGNLIPMVALARFQRFGHTPIALAGGGTGMIGDPSGRSSERNLLSREQLQHNLDKIREQLAMLLDFDVKSNPAKLVNNGDWLEKLNLIDFLRDIGKQFSVNAMLQKDSVKGRMEGGISYTEFSYMLLQSYDFLHLYREHGCVMQTGGSDQWGNITAGTDLIRREGGRAHALVFPLITKADGSKFGKTASGAVWLDAEKTSPFRFYQFWINADDRDIAPYLKKFTFLEQDTVNELIAAHEEAPHQRVAHKRLAQEVTRLIHGDTALENAEKATNVLFGGSIDGLGAAEISDIFAEVPSTEVLGHDLDGGKALVDILAESGVASGKKDAKRSIDGGGIYVNNIKSTESAQTISRADTIDGQFIVIRKGKRKYHLLKVVG
ncbi:MAG: tyrosyl-tRNA synthetase [Cellvibrionaceae bacterium]|jgi:tyrosyl-tRNA synthetase